MGIFFLIHIFLPFNNKPYDLWSWLGGLGGGGVLTYSAQHNVLLQLLLWKIVNTMVVWIIVQKKERKENRPRQKST